MFTQSVRSALKFFNAPRSFALLMLLAVAIPFSVQPLVTNAAGVDNYATGYADRVVDRGFVTVFGRHVDTKSREYWYPRVMEKGSASWFAAAIMDSNEYRRGLGTQSNSQFIDTLYTRAASRKATSGEQVMWQAAFKNGSQNRSTMVGWVVENLYTYKLRRPMAVVNCAKYNKGGSIIPLCQQGLAGDQRSVSILKIPNTTIYVNRVWYQDVDSFVKYAKTKGYTLDAYRSNSTPSWMLSPGSWRSWDEQNWLYTHVNPETGKPYPANPPGKSMHEWGLAIDLKCNGKSIQDVPDCWKWVRANGGNYNVRNFHTVDSIGDSEAWHFSSNGL